MEKIKSALLVTKMMIMKLSITIMHPETRFYVKQEWWMTYFTGDDELLKKYIGFSNKVSNSIVK